MAKAGQLRLVAKVAPPPAFAQARGYQVQYYPDIVNRCPGCGKSNWWIGRFSAECAYCQTAIPLMKGTR